MTDATPLYILLPNETKREVDFDKKINTTACCKYLSRRFSCSFGWTPTARGVIHLLYYILWFSWNCKQTSRIKHHYELRVPNSGVCGDHCEVNISKFLVVLHCEIQRNSRKEGEWMTAPCFLTKIRTYSEVLAHLDGKWTNNKETKKQIIWFTLWKSLAAQSNQWNIAFSENNLCCYRRILYYLKYSSTQIELGSNLTTVSTDRLVFGEETIAALASRYNCFVSIFLQTHCFEILGR